VQESRAQLRAELQQHTMYELLGGEAGIQAIVDTFYDVMEAEPAFANIRSMHKADLSPMRLSLFEFLSGWLGGPSLFIQRHGSPCLTEAHAPFTIGPGARDLWLGCMERALAKADVPQRYRDALMPAFGGMADQMRNDDGPAACEH
jgi:hemoglobin